MKILVMGRDAATSTLLELGGYAVPGRSLVRGRAPAGFTTPWEAIIREPLAGLGPIS